MVGCVLLYSFVFTLPITVSVLHSSSLPSFGASGRVFEVDTVHLSSILGVLLLRNVVYCVCKRAMYRTAKAAFVFWGVALIWPEMGLRFVGHCVLELRGI